MADLVGVAEHGTAAQLEVIVRGLRSVDAVEQANGEPRPEPYVRSTWTDRSQWRLSARLDPEDGALVEAALGAAARADGDESPGPALVRLAEIALAALADRDRAPRPLRGDERAAIVIHVDGDELAAAVAAEGTNRGVGDATRDGPTCATGRTTKHDPDDHVTDCGGQSGGAVDGSPGETDDADTRNRRILDPGNVGGGTTTTGSVHDGRVHIDGPVEGIELTSSVDHSVAVDGTIPRNPEEPVADRATGGLVAGRVAGGPGLPPQVLRRLACAGRVRLAVRGSDGEVEQVSGCRRLVSDRQFRALLLRHGGHCAHPGCRSRSALEAHHVVHWVAGGQTVVRNMVLFCRRHHHAHHDGEFRIAFRGTRGFAFLRADGRLLEEHIDPSRLETATVPIEDEHDYVDPDAAVSRWDGTRLDRRYAVSALAEPRYRSQKASTAATRMADAGFDPWAILLPA